MMRLFRRAFRRLMPPPYEPLSDEAMSRLLLLADLSPSTIADGQQHMREVDALRGLGLGAVKIITDSLTADMTLHLLERERAERDGHCRPGRRLGLTCCSYECSRGRCPSAIAAGIIPDGEDEGTST
jgi:hypothetical protein